MNVDKFLEQLNISKSDFLHIKKSLKREPNELELHLFSAMYSEHCGYRHSRKYLAKLPRKFKNAKAVFHKENAGGIVIGNHAVLFKMESHNHPSAVEPFNGAATGIGGIIRDVLAMNARPIALSDSLKFGSLEDKKSQHIFEGVVNGISAYGNCIGVPTLEGECDFDPAYGDNPLVNVMALGIAKTKDIVTSKAHRDSLIVLLGSATMKDGIGGAAFASKDLNDEFEENRISVQIADPLMEKKLIEATLEILGEKLAHSCQDCGAAGILSSTSEMAFKGDCGMNLYLDKVHLAQKDMKPWQIMLSETQERMMFCVTKEKLEKIEAISKKYEIPYAVIGETIEDKSYRLFWAEEKIADLPVGLISDAPFVKVNPRKPAKPCFTAVGSCTETVEPRSANIEDCSAIMSESLKEGFSKLVNDPSFASKEWIYSQYDHTVGARTVLPPEDKGASSIWLHEENCFLGIATSSLPHQVQNNPYEGTINTVYESARKLVASGFEPMAITNCLNFANPNKPETMWQFKESLKGLAKALKQLQIPVVSGNVSFYNESQNLQVPPTPTVVMVGINRDFETIVKRDFSIGETVILIESTSLGCADVTVDFKAEKNLKAFLLRNPLIKSCLSVSKGGVAGALFKGIAPKENGFSGSFEGVKGLFEHHQGRYLLGTNAVDETANLLKKKKIKFKILGTVSEKDFVIDGEEIDSTPLFGVYKSLIKDKMSK